MPRSDFQKIALIKDFLYKQLQVLIRYVVASCPGLKTISIR